MVRFKIVGFSIPNALTRFDNKSSDRNVPNRVSEIKVPSKVFGHERHPIQTAIGPPWCSQVKRG
jgi:hypothetical protein